MNKEKEKIAQIEKVNDKIYVFNFKLPTDEDDFQWKLGQIREAHKMLQKFFHEQNKYFISLPYGEELTEYSLEDLKFYQKQLNQIIQKMKE